MRVKVHLSGLVILYVSSCVEQTEIDIMDEDASKEIW
jgi:hypothetical protein